MRRTTKNMPIKKKDTARLERETLKVLNNENIRFCTALPARHPCEMMKKTKECLVWPPMSKLLII